jgi:predicted esterase/LysM repeat protein
MLALSPVRTLWVCFTALALLLATSPAEAQRPRIHVVASGHTLGKIAKRYNVTIDAICTANGIERRKPIQIGQKLVIPNRDDKDGSRAARDRRQQAATPKTQDSPPEQSSPARSDDEAQCGPSVLEVAGAPPAYYYPPVGPGRLSLRPVIFYLHGRGGYPKAVCQRWAPVARRYGWLVCPSGPLEREDGGREWKSWTAARGIVMATLGALRAKYGRRVQLYGNTIVGHSEGAYAAMNVGVHEPRAFNRWLILAGTDRYWANSGLEALARNRSRVRRVYLITGAQDGVVEGTKTVLQQLRSAGVPVRIYVADDMGHELRLESKASLYGAALRWLERGGSVATTEVAARAKSAQKQ